MVGFFDPNENRAEIIRRLKGTNRPGIDELIAAMDEGGFFESPCSGGYHLCEKGGLAEHTLNVCDFAIKVAEALVPEKLDELRESITIAALLHDLGKMGDFSKCGYVPNLLKSGKPSASKPFKVNKDLLNVPHSIRSVKIASQYIKLSEDEEYAILMHDGMYGDLKYAVQGNETLLYFIIHTADFYSARFFEVDGNGGDAEE